MDKNHNIKIKLGKTEMFMLEKANVYVIRRNDAAVLKTLRRYVLLMLSIQVQKTNKFISEFFHLTLNTGNITQTQVVMKVNPKSKQQISITGNSYIIYQQQGPNSAPKFSRKNPTESRKVI